MCSDTIENNLSISTLGKYNGMRISHPNRYLKEEKKRRFTLILSVNVCVCACVYGIYKVAQSIRYQELVFPPIVKL